MKLKITAATAATILVVTSLTAQARFDCGRTVKALTHSSCGSNLARAWAADCPHTYARRGAVVVFTRHGMDSSGRHRGGHVALIVSDPVGCMAKVRDERGTYERDICKNQIAVVDPNG